MADPAAHEAREEAGRRGLMLGSDLDRAESDLLAERGDGPAELVELPRCRFTPDTCIDDLCRTGGERGLCGNYRLDAFEDWGDDGHDDDWPEWGDDNGEPVSISDLPEHGAWIDGEGRPA